MKKAIRDIARGPRKQQCEPRGHARTAGAAGDEEPGEHGDDHEGARDQNVARPRRSRIRKEAESDAGIAAVDEIKKVVDEFAVPAFEGLRLEPSCPRMVSKGAYGGAFRLQLF